MRHKFTKGVATLFLLGTMVMTAGCSKGGDSSNLAFTQIKTTGVVDTVSPDKVTMIVSEDDKNFKKDDQVVVTFQNIYLSKSLSNSDVLTKADNIEAGNHVYVIYSEEERKDNVINVNDIVIEEAK